MLVAILILTILLLANVFTVVPPVGCTNTLPTDHIGAENKKIMASF